MLAGNVATDGTGNAAQMLLSLFLPGAIVIGRHFFFLCHGQTASSKESTGIESPKTAKTLIPLMYAQLTFMFYDRQATPLTFLCYVRVISHSHSIVPGGLDVMS